MNDRLKTPYEKLDKTEKDMHPVDAYIEKHFPVENLREMIRETYRRLRLALLDDGDFQEVLELEQNETELRLSRQENYFDAGYDHGFSDGSAQVFKDIHNSPHSDSYTKLTQTVRNTATLSGLPDYMKVAAILEAAWSITMGNQLKMFIPDDEN